MRYATVNMLMNHAGKSRSAVVRALKAAKVPIETTPGVKGGRILEREANKFLTRQWPDVGPLPPQCAPREVAAVQSEA